MSDVPDPGWDAEETRAWYEYREAQRSAARDAFIAQAAEDARQAIVLNQQIRDANAQMRADFTAFLAATPPTATNLATLGDKVEWLYQRMRDLVTRVLSETQAVDILTKESDGLISLFASVIPALDDLMDEMAP